MVLIYPKIRAFPDGSSGWLGESPKPPLPRAAVRGWGGEAQSAVRSDRERFFVWRVSLDLENLPDRFRLRLCGNGFGWEPFGDVLRKTPGNDILWIA